MKKYQSFLFENFQFLEVKFSVYLNRHVLVMRGVCFAIACSTFFWYLSRLCFVTVAFSGFFTYIYGISFIPDLRHRCEHMSLGTLFPDETHIA